MLSGCVLDWARSSPDASLVAGWLRRTWSRLLAGVDDAMPMPPHHRAARDWSGETSDADRRIDRRAGGAEPGIHDTEALLPRPRRLGCREGACLRQDLAAGGPD